MKNDESKNEMLSNPEYPDGEPEIIDGAPQTEQAEDSRAGPRFLYELFDWSESLVVALSVIVILFAFFVRSIGVSGTSMINTLQDGDYLIVSNLFYEPAQGDIIVLTKKTFDTDSIVKRIIALGGQSVDMDFTTGEVWVDGELLDEPYLREQMTRSGDVKFPVTVPEGSVFVMGDNRNGSTDSRTTAVGMVDERYIVGHVLLRIWPLNAIGPVDN